MSNDHMALIALAGRIVGILQRVEKELANITPPNTDAYSLVQLARTGITETREKVETCARILWLARQRKDDPQ